MAKATASLQLTTTNPTPTITVKMHPEFLGKEPGWPTCPHCGEGHDPCESCFA
jgi:hypothetical protein